jgi:hypothetical protein
LQTESAANTKTRQKRKVTVVAGMWIQIGSREQDWCINCMSIPTTTLSLRDRFATIPLFRDVIDALQGIQSGLGLRERKRARHCSAQYMIEDGKLWFIGGGTQTRAVARRECVTREEAVELARIEHEKGGRFHRDLIKITLLDKIHTPGLDQSII